MALPSNGENLEAEQRKQGLEEALAKIRHHTSSKLPNQKAPAQLLLAVEETLKGSKTDEEGKEQRSPTEYLMALQSMLKKASKESTKSTKNSNLLSSTMYLLTLVAPFVAPGVLRSQLANLIEPLGLVLSTPYSTTPDQPAESHAALLRSAMGVLQQLLLSMTLDRATLSSNLPLRGCWNSTLRLCMDARPKVRRRAQDLVGKVLEMEENAKPHPYAAKTAEWAISALEEVNVSGSVNSAQAKAVPTYDKKAGKASQPEISAAQRQKQVDAGSANTGIWICAFLKQLAPVLPSKSIPHLSTNLLRLISQRNPFLSTAAFEVFESLFRIGKPSSINYTFNTTSHMASQDAPGTNVKKINVDTIAQTLDALCSSSVKPNPNDVQLIPAYLRALENAMVAYSRVEEGQLAWRRVPAIWKTIVEISLSTNSKASRDSPSTRIAGRDALSALVRYCIPDQAIDKAIIAKKAGQQNPLDDITAFFKTSLEGQVLKYSHTQPLILSVLATLMLRLRHRPSTASSSTSRPNPAATFLLLPIVSTIGTLRTQSNYEHREEADNVIGAAIEVCGPAAVLEILPLNLASDEELVNGRAWLLPLMKSRITNSQLKHFVTVMVPLSENLFNKKAEAEKLNKEGKPTAPVQAKVFEALIEQVWALFSGYCDLPIDMKEALSVEFVELLANVLYYQSTLRPSICRGLQVLVERNLSLANSSADVGMLTRNFGLNSVQGKENIAQLTEIAPNILAVLFNVFSQSPGESRGYLADCMNAYLSIMTKEEVSKTFTKIVTMLDQSLPTLVPARDREVGPGSVPPIPHTMLDLLILLVAYLDPTQEGSKLFEMICDDKLLACRDAGLQKKTYRLLARLMAGKQAKQILQVSEGKAERLQELLQKLQSTTENVVAGAKRDRTALLASLVPLIPQTELHLLPSIIPEAVLATKEVNQGARELAFNLLVEMGNKMEIGGQLKRHLVEGASGSDEKEDDEMKDEEMREDIVDASLNEYITMVAAGLAGSTPHMVSATIMAMARLVYEFHPRLPLRTLKELVSTLEVFLASPNREIVKSTLGFVKVVVVSLPTNTMEENLSTIIHGLLSDDNHHRQHFKAKIRHIFERLLRRFGYEKIETMTDEENRKLLVNIRKRKERAKRKKLSQVEGEGDEEDEEDEEAGGAVGAGQRAIKSVGADAFEEAIYGSESDLSASDDDGDADNEMVTSRGRSQTRGGAAGAAVQAAGGGGKRREKQRRGKEAEAQEYILQDDDDPMDLLDRSIAAGGRITSAKAAAAAAMQKSGKKKPGEEARRFELDEATGRMVIDEPDTNAQIGNDSIDLEGGGRAYLDRERGTHGITNTNGVVRLNKNNKRNRAADEELELEQMIIEDQQTQQASSIQQSKDNKKGKHHNNKVAIGADFKAKKAGGDIKKGDTKPFAYLPLNQIGSKNKVGNVKILSRDKRRKV